MILADENIDRSLVETIRQLGIDVFPFMNFNVVHPMFQLLNFRETLPESS